MKYKTVCYAYSKRTGDPLGKIFDADSEKIKIAGISRYYNVSYTKIDKIIVREELCQTGN